MSEETVDCVIVGGGPAGLSAALNLGRARRSVVVVDANRPRNAATLSSHGFLTRDGIPPHELRRLAREELEAYPNIEFRARASAERVEADGDGFLVDVGGSPAVRGVVRTRTVLAAHGLHETLPALPSIRSYYGMSLFSCVACDAHELSGRDLALIGESDDLAARALLISQWTPRLTVFTNGSGEVTEHQEAHLAARGIAVERRGIADLEGDRSGLTGVRLADGAVIEVQGGFVRPAWHAELGFLGSLGADVDAAGLLVSDRDGRTRVAGLYAAGDVTSGPQQLIVAAGSGGRVATVINHDLVGHELLAVVGAH